MVGTWPEAVKRYLRALYVGFERSDRVLNRTHDRGNPRAERDLADVLAPTGFAW